jgi:serine/threonine protein kinase
MDHANIAKILDAGTTATGRPYFVMELVKGVPITEFCDKNRLSPEARLKLFLDVCHAIQHAHHKGIIHRDVKPSNVLVTVCDGSPVVKVIDFGIAKALGQKLTENTMFTAHGQMIGTPAYMSPEQAMGDAAISPASDQYSLACVLFEMLSGRTPFQGSSALATLALHNSGPIPDVRQLRDGIPPGVAEALEIALAKDPANRFPSVDAFVRALGGDTTGSTASISPTALPTSCRLASAT